MKHKNVFSAGTNLSGFGGAQKMMVDIHRGIKQQYPDAKILGFQKYKDLNIKYQISRDEYIEIGNPFYLKNAIILIHARKLTTYYSFINKLFRLNLRMIYVSHNIYSEKRSVTFLPKEIISISDKVTDNLVSYFKVRLDQITKIHNGIPDTAPATATLAKRTRGIDILYSARLTDVKRQVAIVQYLKDKIPNNVRIMFAGTGPDTDALRKEIGNSKNFQMLGFVDDMDTVLQQSDYLMLFSTKEGLPISLMEGTMYSKPLIVNDVGGNLEIGVAGTNAFVAETFPELADLLCSLPEPGSDAYQKLSMGSRSHFEKFFRYETMIEKYINVINRTL